MNSAQQEPTETNGSQTIETGTRSFLNYQLTGRGSFKK